MPRGETSERSGPSLLRTALPDPTRHAITGGSHVPGSETPLEVPRMRTHVAILKQIP